MWRTRGYGTDLGSISVIDTSTNTATTPTNLSYTGGEISIPIGIAVTPNGASVYVTNFGTDTVAVIATATNTVTATIPVGGGPSRVAITPDGTKAYVSNEFGGTVSVINTATNTLVGGPISVGSSPAGVAITPNGAYAYVANFGVQPPLSYAATAILPQGAVYGFDDWQCSPRSSSLSQGLHLRRPTGMRA